MLKQLIKIVSIVVAVAALSGVIAGCGTSQTTSDDDMSNKVVVDKQPIENEPQELHIFDIDNKEIFEDGYCVVRAELEYLDEQTVYFGRFRDTNVDWYVYVFDEELEEVSLEILNDLEPQITNEGQLKVTQGQWIYIVCSCNSTNSKEPSNSNYSASYFGP